MDKPANTAFPIHKLLAGRWSPRAFQDREIGVEILGSLFEAARWAPSCFNEQPWRFVVARRGESEEFERLSACLSEGNAWARGAPVLVLSIAKSAFTRNDKPNRHAWHDVGLATENLVLQAEAMGLRVHQMAGFDREQARETLGIPDGYEPATMIAIGYPGDARSLSEELAARERAPRTRREIGELVFDGRFGQPMAFTD